MLLIRRGLFCWSYLNEIRQIGSSFLFVTVSVCSVLFPHWSLVAGGLASGRHAHNPQQSSSHHFIFPVLWSSLASVCGYDNFACEIHWPPIMKFLCDSNRWETRSSERDSLRQYPNSWHRTLWPSNGYVPGFYIWMSSKPHHRWQNCHVKKAFCALKGSGAPGIWHGSTGCLLS